MCPPEGSTPWVESSAESIVKWWLCFLMASVLSFPYALSICPTRILKGTRTWTQGKYMGKLCSSYLSPHPSNTTFRFAQVSRGCCSPELNAEREAGGSATEERHMKRCHNTGEGWLPRFRAETDWISQSWGRQEVRDGRMFSNILKDLTPTFKKPFQSTEESPALEVLCVIFCCVTIGL